MRDDADLNFLEQIESEKLTPLVEIITTAKDGTARITESLSEYDRYKENEPNHHEYWDLIADEIQRFGANSLVTLVRGHGVPYKDVLIDVAKKMKVNFNKDASVEIIEMNLLMKILTESMEKMSESQLKEVVEGLKLKTTNYSAQAVTAALQTGIKMSGFMAYKTALIVANAVAKQVLGHGLKLSTNAALTKTMGVFAGPIGWAITGTWTVVDLAGPAYRVTIPAVIQVAFLRAQHNHEQ